MSHRTRHADSRTARSTSAALAKLVDWQIEQGVDGIVSVGTTGESATLDVDEHVAVIAATVKAARGRVPVIAGAGGNATCEALALTKASEDAGADALLHVTPYYNRPSQEGLFRHFEAIARATKLPIILYNVPTRTACDLLHRDGRAARATSTTSSASRTRPATSCAAASSSRSVGDRIDHALGRRRHRVPALRGRRARRDLGRVERRAARDERDVGRGEGRRLGARAQAALQAARAERRCCSPSRARRRPRPRSSLLGRCAAEVRLPLVPASAEAASRSSAPRCTRRALL